MRNDAINPEHYNRLNPQPKDVIREWGLNFNLGSAVKYISRAGHKDDIVQDLKKAQEFIQFEIDAIEKTREQKAKEEPKRDKYQHYTVSDAVKDILKVMGTHTTGSIDIKCKKNGKTDEEINTIIERTLRDIISGMAGVELVDITEGKGYSRVCITGCNVDPKEVQDYIERELRDRLAMVL